MRAFHLTHTAIDPALVRGAVADPGCGGYASFEGWVRDHNEGQRVRRLEYEALEPLAVKEGERILLEAQERFGVTRLSCVHRVGNLAIGDIAVCVGVSAPHRQEAFLACRYVIDEVKHRLPIWKKEHYESGDSGWVNCERCAVGSHVHTESTHAGSQHGHSESTHAGSQHAHSDSTPAQLAVRAAGSLAPDYSRQSALKEVGEQGQERLRASGVLVVGAGGLGVPVLAYLTGAGVGRIGIVDGDRLEPSNLHRQTLYALEDTGQWKAELAARRLRALNPEVELHAHCVRLDATNGLTLLAPYDLVVDCTDNFSTKFLLNDFCLRLGKPAVFSSVYQYEGQLQVLRGDRRGACLRCIWPQATRDGLVGNCAEAGVLGPVPGVFGTLQALEVLKILLDLPGQLTDELLVMDLMSLAVSRVRARRAAACAGKSCVRINAQPEEHAAIEVSLDTLDEALRQGFAIVDVRDAHELSAMPNPAAAARHVPLSKLLSDPGLDPAGKYLLVCATGKRSLGAAQELRSRGLGQVYSFKGGLRRLRQGLPA